MPLWRVDVAGISVRYLDAPTKASAVKQVERDLVAHFHLAASRAPATLQVAYESAGPIQRKQMLAAMDGLNTPTTRRHQKGELRKLQRWEEASDAWVQAEIVKVPPPPDPAAIGRMLRDAEIRHIERNLRHRRDREPPSPYHQA